MSCQFKRFICAGQLIIFFAAVVVITTGCHSKAPDTFPSVNLFTLDSNTTFNTASIPEGKPIMMFYFRPYCKHCKQETEDILTNHKSFRDVQIIFVSADNLDEVRFFAKYYNLQQYKNIQIAWDKDFNFHRSFKPKAIPYQVIYDRSRKLVRSFDGETKWTELVAAIKGS